MNVAHGKTIFLKKVISEISWEPLLLENFKKSEDQKKKEAVIVIKVIKENKNNKKGKQKSTFKAGILYFSCL